MDTLKLLLPFIFILSACGNHQAKSQFYEKSGDNQKPIESNDPFVLLQQAIFDEDLEALFKIIESEKMSVDITLKTDRTLLAEATFLKKTKIIRALVQNGANTEISTIENQSLQDWIKKQPDYLKLNRALFKTALEDQQEFIVILVQNNFRPLKALLDEGINLNFLTPEGSTPLILAIENQWMNSIRVLFSDSTLDVNLANLSGETPLTVARRKNLKNIETELLKRFAKE